MPGSADQCMYLVGVIEIVAGVLVAVAPRIGAWVVAAWLAGIIVDLLTLSGYYDIALRDRSAGRSGRAGPVSPRRSQSHRAHVALGDDPLAQR